MSASRRVRPGAAMLLLALLAACAPAPMGQSEERPYWRRPGPALIEPQERRVLQDDGYLARQAAPAAGRSAWRPVRQGGIADAVDRPREHGAERDPPEADHAGAPAGRRPRRVLA